MVSNMRPTLRLLTRKKLDDNSGKIDLTTNWYFNINADKQNPYDVLQPSAEPYQFKLNTKPEKQVVVCPLCTGRADNFYPVVLDDEQIKEKDIAALTLKVQLTNKRYYFQLTTEQRTQLSGMLIFMGLCKWCISGYGNNINRELSSRINLSWPELLIIPYFEIKKLLGQDNIEF